MSSPDHSASNNEDAFSTNISNYVSTIPNYFPASSGKTYSNALNNSTGKIPPEVSPFYNMKDLQAFYAKELPIPSPDPITPPVILTPSPVLPPSLLFDPRYFFVPEELLPPKKQIHPSSSSSTTMPPKRVSTSTAPAMTQATIRQLISNGIAAALEALDATMANTDNPNRNLRSKETPVAKRGNYKEFISCQPFYFNGMKGAVGLICWFEPLNLEEVITITQRLMEQVIKHKSAQEADDHKRKFKDRRNTTGNNNNHSNNHNNNNFQDNRNNNNRNHNYHHKQNKRQEAIRAYAVNPTKNNCNAQKQTIEPHGSILRDKFASVHFRISTLKTTL
uniref:Reverse transcriptase domain-containing protein n=1 Tax=Tanacetum cinerariifolium TaxID=118510 RepID=A0A6L2MTD0_TANCI|nr:reverse transcriptase domain-containing protein [Tanacetum cinerariifolium]